MRCEEPHEPPIWSQVIVHVRSSCERTDDAEFNRIRFVQMLQRVADTVRGQMHQLHISDQVYIDLYDAKAYVTTRTYTCQFEYIIYKKEFDQG